MVFTGAARNKTTTDDTAMAVIKVRAKEGNPVSTTNNSNQHQ